MPLTSIKHPVLGLASLALVVGLCLTPAGAVRADGPDYGAPATWLLPWRGGDTHRITWGAEDHWAHGKATGVAFDVTMVEGVPIYAPADGTAHFRLDSRLLSTTLGNYVDLQTDDGWLIRLAHLRDERIEVRQIKAGELLGYAGSSGVSASHLHVEILVREDGAWRCPDSGRLSVLFGRPADAFVPGALVVNDGCAGMLVSDGDARTWLPSRPLGEAALVLLPLRNEGDRPLDLSSIQLMLESPVGETVLVDAEGAWRFPARSLRTLALHVYPDMAGVWQVRGVRYVAGEQACAVAMGGTLLVEALPVTLTSLVMLSSATTGSPVEVALALSNGGERPLEADDLLVWGQAPSGATWQATYGDAVRLDAGNETAFSMRNGPLYDQVGLWQVGGVALVRDGRAYRVAFGNDEIDVAGPQLTIEKLDVYAAERGPIILMHLANVGDQTAHDVRVEVWGWYGQAGGEAGSATALVDELEPGQSTLLRLQVQALPGHGEWRLAGAGYWLADVYLPVVLPALPETLGQE